MKLPGLDIEKVLFLDIETVPQAESYSAMPERMQKLWDQKATTLKADSGEEVFDRAGIYAEFGKIVCISTGFIRMEGPRKVFRIKSFYGDDESILLQEFAELLNRHFGGHDNLLCAHNGKEFDFPYCARRMIINGIELPVALDIAGKKPWEIKHLDTMQLWKFGDFKSYTSLDLLTAVFGIPTPKDAMHGSEVMSAYYEDNNLEGIVEYCQKDVVALAQVMLSMIRESLIQEDDIIIV